LIIDDVVTTGSSIYALHQALQQLGCQQIYACCIAAATNQNAKT
jgi:predicted amidophosphoribosyltransferase